MFGSVRIGKIGGISIEVHVTFLLTVLWAAWQGALLYGGLSGAAYGTTLILLLFTCVFLHELGHSLQATALGVGVQRITLLPIGGLARLESMHNSPRSELLITLAGPAVNLALALILGGIALALGHPTLTAWALIAGGEAGQLAPDSLLLFLLGANVSLFVFNMLPAFPMDGGRIARALLALLIDYETATRIAATLGRLMAALLAGVGVFGLPAFGIPPNLILALIGVMIYGGATQEAAYVRRREALSRIAVGQAASRRRYALSPSDRVTPALAQSLFSQQSALPVVVGARLIGLLTLKELRRSATLPTPTYVAHVMRTDFPVLNIGETLWTALEALQSYKLEAAPVVHNGALHGMLSLADINRVWRRPHRQRRQPHAAPTPGG